MIGLLCLTVVFYSYHKRVMCMSECVRWPASIDTSYPVRETFISLYNQISECCDDLRGKFDLRSDPICPETLNRC